MSKKRLGAPGPPVEPANLRSILTLPPRVRATPAGKKSQGSAVIVDLQQHAQEALQKVALRRANLFRCQVGRAASAINSGGAPAYSPKRTTKSGKGHLTLISDRTGHDETDVPTAQPKLPDERMEAFCLIAVENLSPTEAAVALGIDLETLEILIAGLLGPFRSSPSPDP